MKTNKIVLLCLNLVLLSPFALADGVGNNGGDKQVLAKCAIKLENKQIQNLPITQISSRLSDTDEAVTFYNGHISANGFDITVVDASCTPGSDNCGEDIENLPFSTIVVKDITTGKIAKGSNFAGDNRAILQEVNAGVVEKAISCSLRADYGALKSDL